MNQSQAAQARIQVSSWTQIKIVSQTVQNNTQEYRMYIHHMYIYNHGQRAIRTSYYKMQSCSRNKYIQNVCMHAVPCTNCKTAHSTGTRRKSRDTQSSAQLNWVQWKERSCDVLTATKSSENVVVKQHRYTINQIQVTAWTHAWWRDLTLNQGLEWIDHSLLPDTKFDQLTTAKHYPWCMPCTCTYTRVHRDGKQESNQGHKNLMKTAWRS